MLEMLVMVFLMILVIWFLSLEGVVLFWLIVIEIIGMLMFGKCVMGSLLKV